MAIIDLSQWSDPNVANNCGNNMSIAPTAILGLKPKVGIFLKLTDTKMVPHLAGELPKPSTFLDYDFLKNHIESIT